MDTTSAARFVAHQRAYSAVVRRVAARAVVVLAAVAGASCSRGERSLPPAPYVAPAVGTVYRYVGFNNTVVGVDGMRTRFVDDSGRQGVRVGLFISDDAEHPARIDVAQVTALWPLEVDKQSDVRVHDGARAWLWRFKVVGEQNVNVPAGRFETYVVQAVQRPDSIRDPKSGQETVVGYTFWYAPSIAAVVRFRTTYFSGPATGKVVQSELRGVQSPGTGASTRAGGGG